MRRLTRAEAQQRTRDDILAAAERLFLDKGYVATTVAQIADAAGRTQGAIYANFASKETVCLQILERHAVEIADQVMAELAATGPEPEDKITVLVRTWSVLSRDVGLTTLVAEYLLATRHDAEQRAQLAGQLDMLRALLGAGLDDNLHLPAPSDRVERAALAVVATIAGLAFGQATGVMTVDETSAILEDTLRTWIAAMERVDDPRPGTSADQ